MTDPADTDWCDCEPDPAGIELHNGWTLVAPPGTSRAAAEYAAERLYDDDYLPSPDDAEDAVEEAARRAERDAIGPMHGPPTEHQHMINEMLRETLGRLLGTPTSLMDLMFQDPPKAPKFGTVVYDTVPSSKDSWVKAAFMDMHASQHLTRDQTSRWELMYDPVDQWGAVRPIYDELTRWGAVNVDDDTAALAARWAENPPARPGWTGSVAGRPRPIPLKPTPWQTLPKAMHHGNRTIIIEPGADNNPDARLMEIRGGRLVDIGPAHPNGLAPAYRGRPAPIPWDSPLADPVADMRRAVEEDQ